MMRRYSAAAGIFLIAILSLGIARNSLALQARTDASDKKTAGQRAWDDLRFLAAAIGAYSTDNDDLYAPADAPHEGEISVLDEQLKWYYDNTVPSRVIRPGVDPWERPYRFVISDSRKMYALYSLGQDGKVDPAAEEILRRVKSDRIIDEDLAKRASSPNLVVVSGVIVLAPPDVLRQLD